VAPLLRRLHAVTGIDAPVEDFAVPARADLEAALDDLGSAWTCGPYGEPARAALATGVDSVRARLAEYDALVPTDRSGWVVTHGEPHPQNVLDTSEGVVLVDWDTVKLGPPERDLWMLPEGGGDPALRRLYSLWWDLSEVAIYTSWFRAPHARTADIEKGWSWFEHFLARD
jgi:spectinomycin phosphotransferase